MRTESTIQTEVRAALAQRPDVLVWRNNTGVFWQLTEKSECMCCGARLLAVGIRNASRVTTGLGVGGADLVGVQAIDVTSEHVGTRIGRFIGIEIKTDRGRASDDQKRWLAAAARYGAAAGIARSVDEAMGVVR